MTPTTTGRVVDAVDTARRHDEAFNSRDAEGRMAVMAPDVETLLPGGLSLHGMEQVLGIAMAFWEGLPDARITAHNRWSVGDTVVTEGTLTGTHDGVFRAPQGDIPASGNSVRLRYSSIKQVRDGKVVRERLYFDQLELLQQIAALPAAGRGSVEEHKELVRRVYEDIRGAGDLDLIDDVFAADYVGHDPTAAPPEVHGPDGFRRQTLAYRAAFPDLRFTVDSMVAEGDEVMVRWMASGTHRRSLAGEPPTGKRVEVSGFGSWRMRHGKVVRHWGLLDSASLDRQMELPA